MDGDIVKMVANTRKGHIKYFVNGKYQGIAFGNGSFKTRTYKLYISAGDKGTCMKLIDFESVFQKD